MAVADRLYPADIEREYGIPANTWKQWKSRRQTPPRDGRTADRGHVRDWWLPATVEAFLQTKERPASP